MFPFFAPQVSEFYTGKAAHFEKASVQTLLISIRMKQRQDLKIPATVVSILIGLSLSGEKSFADSKTEALSALKKISLSLSEQLQKVDAQIEALANETFIAEAPPRPRLNEKESDRIERLQQLVEKKQRLLARLDLAGYLSFKIDSSFSDGQALEAALRRSLRDHFLGNISEDSLRSEKGEVPRAVTLEVQDYLFQSRDGSDRKILDRLEQAFTFFGLQ